MKAGTWIIVGLLTLIFILLLGMSALYLSDRARAREAAEIEAVVKHHASLEKACEQQLNLLGLAIENFRIEKRHVPESLNELVTNDPELKPSYLLCPESNRNYVYLGHALGEGDPDAVLIYEPTAAHQHGLAYLTTAGLVKHVSDSKATTFLAELAAGKNPPPSAH